MRINLLGRFEVQDDHGRVLPQPGPKRRALLAALALELGRTVPAERLMDLLWNGAPPSTARSALQGHVTAVRRLLADAADGGPATGSIAEDPDGLHLVTRDGGYALLGHPDAVDAHRFARLCAAAEQSAAEAAVLLRTALALWRGPALDRCGSTRLAAEAGPRLTAARERAAERLAGGRPTGGPRTGGGADGFLGRAGDLARLDTAAADADGRPLLLTGPVGVGKTRLARRWADLRAGLFPDGRYAVDLQGDDPGSDDDTIAATALAALLRDLGAGELPADTDERAALLRTLTAGRRLLLLLDNAGSAEQVEPLLPGHSEVLVVVTGRSPLTGLVAREGAVALPLGGLAPAEAVGLLAAVTGTGQVAREPEAAARVAALCDHLPLALRVAGARLAADPATSVAELAEELAWASGRFGPGEAPGGGGSVEAASDGGGAGGGPTGVVGATVRGLSGTGLGAVAVAVAGEGAPVPGGSDGGRVGPPGEAAAGESAQAVPEGTPGGGLSGAAPGAVVAEEEEVAGPLGGGARVSPVVEGSAVRGPVADGDDGSGSRQEPLAEEDLAGDAARVASSWVAVVGGVGPGRPRGPLPEEDLAGDAEPIAPEAAVDAAAASGVQRVVRVEEGDAASGDDRGAASGVRQAVSAEDPAGEPLRVESGEAPDGGAAVGAGKGLWAGEEAVGESVRIVPGEDGAGAARQVPPAEEDGDASGDGRQASPGVAGTPARDAAAGRGGVLRRAQGPLPERELKEDPGGDPVRPVPSGAPGGGVLGAGQGARAGAGGAVRPGVDGVVAAIGVGRRALPVEVGRVFALTGLVPGAGLDPEAVAAVAGLSAARAREVLDRLAVARLVEEDGPAWFGRPEPVRRAAAEAAAGLPAVERTAAVRRLLGRWTQIAEAACDASGEPGSTAGGPSPGSPAGPGDGTGWFRRERRALSALARLGAAYGLDAEVWRLAHACGPLHYQDGAHLDAWEELARTGLAAAERLGDRAARVRLRTDLALALVSRQRFTDAAAVAEPAVADAAELGDTAVRDRCLTALAGILAASGRCYGAIAVLERVVASCEARADGPATARALDHLAHCLHRVGETERGLALTERALDTVRDRIGDPLQGALRFSRAEALRVLGREEEALAASGEALALAEERGDTRLLLLALDFNGAVLAELGRPEEAAHCWRRALELHAAEGRAHPALERRLAALREGGTGGGTGSGPGSGPGSGAGSGAAEGTGQDAARCGIVAG
ncbi:BTAD domain-containing putative transcriptional regulator [Kitasatospora sp. NPDC056327]|uniref:BTAD domain-containing putative transcriptional regulator n=1 Tax=Kitasatospora sp. NPDC056327 TaxID=3345785 RepID=UPI0035E00DAB